MGLFWYLGFYWTLALLGWLENYPLIFILDSVIRLMHENNIKYPKNYEFDFTIIRLISEKAQNYPKNYGFLWQAFP